jgi:uncharacterized protein (DUF1330 family)
MAGFVIVDVTINEHAEYEIYKKLAPPSIAAYGGKHIVRGGHTEILGGNWLPKRFVMLEFADVAQRKHGGRLWNMRLQRPSDNGLQICK